MTTMHRMLRIHGALLIAALSAMAVAQDANITQPVADLERLLTAEPMVIEQAEISRPKAAGDITLKAQVSFGGAPPLRVKLRKAEPGADAFNNVPRYDLAAYELQKLFLDPAEYVVPPTALRMLPIADLAPYSSAVTVARTFAGADQVLAVLQYWLNDTKVVADVYSPRLYDADPVYARHLGQLNILTYLISHSDSNVGNFLISKAETAARVFSVDNGIAFSSGPADRGEIWKQLRVKSLPADAIERLRTLTPEILQGRLAVLAQWKLEGARYVPVALSANMAPERGVRIKAGVIQMGLTEGEIRAVNARIHKLLKQVDSGRITVSPVPAH